MLILSVESTCDETAVAVTENGRKVLTDQIFSQADLHAVYGGVVPEIASRKHVEAIAGFGPGAHSDFGGVRYAYTKDLEGYIRGVRDHAPMLSESDRIPPLDRDTEWVMLGLRTTAGLDPKAFERRFRRRFTCFLPFLDQCARAGYAVEEDGRWHLTPRGFLVSNQIIGGMLDALAADKQRRADAAARGDFRVNLD